MRSREILAGLTMQTLRINRAPADSPWRRGRFLLWVVGWFGELVLAPARRERKPAERDREPEAGRLATRSFEEDDKGGAETE